MYSFQLIQCGSLSKTGPDTHTTCITTPRSVTQQGVSDLAPYHMADGSWQGNKTDYTTAVVGNVSMAWLRKVARADRPFFACKLAPSEVPFVCRLWRLKCRFWRLQASAAACAACEQVPSVAPGSCVCKGLFVRAGVLAPSAAHTPTCPPKRSYRICIYLTRDPPPSPSPFQTSPPRLATSPSRLPPGTPRTGPPPGPPASRAPPPGTARRPRARTTTA
jgi:hypothetical protein